MSYVSSIIQALKRLYTGCLAGEDAPQQENLLSSEGLLKKKRYRERAQRLYRSCRFERYQYEKNSAYIASYQGLFERLKLLPASNLGVREFPPGLALIGSYLDTRGPRLINASYL